MITLICCAINTHCGILYYDFLDNSRITNCKKPDIPVFYCHGWRNAQINYFAESHLLSFPLWEAGYWGYS